MAIQSFNFYKPDNSVSFESHCLKIFRSYLKLPHLQKFGRLGHSQFGIDLLSVESDHVIGIQCRSKLTSKGLTKDEVDAIIEDAKTFEPHLAELLIATSADRDPDLQRYVANVTLSHQAGGLFKVLIYAWQDIEEILKQDSGLVSELYSLPSPPIASAGIATYAQIGLQALLGHAHAEIDEASRYIIEGNPDAGLALLQRLQRERWDHLTPRERFKIVANIGTGYLAKGEEQKAAHAFLEAATHLPLDDEGALGVAAHGHLLSGDREQAYLLASDACRRNPMSERAQIIKIKGAPDNIALEELLTTVPPFLKSTLNVALALYERAMEGNDPLKAEKVLKEVHEDSPTLHFSLGAALLQQGLPAAAHEGMRLLPRDSGLVHAAREHLTRAIESPGAPASLVASACFNRGLASLLLGDDKSALIDFHSAHSKKPGDEHFATAFTMETWRSGDLASALNGAKELFKNHPTPRSRLLLGIVLYDSDGDVERQRARALLQEGVADLGEVEVELRLEYIRRTLYILQLSGELNRETTEVTIRGVTDPLERGIIFSWALQRMGFQEEAKTEAKEMSGLLGKATNLILIREFAVLLSRLGLAEEALPIWAGLSSFSVFNEDTLIVLQTAADAERDDLVLDYCERLRVNGIYAPEVAAMEVDLLIRYSEPTTARAVVIKYLDSNPADFNLKLLLLNLAVTQEWPDIVDAYTDALPNAKDIAAAVDGARLAQILRFKGDANAAAIIAYDLVRRFPDDPLSHRAIITLILGWPKGDLALDAPKQVVPGSAVCLKIEGHSEWLTIEDSEKPEISRGEYSPEHPLAQALLGKSVGDLVILPQSLMRSKSAEIVEIKHKILHRMHESMAQMNRHFPEQSFFESVSINFDAKGHELDELIEVNRLMAGGRIAAEGMYNEKRIPLNTLAAAAGKDLPVVMRAFALDERRSIYCFEGRAEDFDEAKTLLGSAREVVLDLVALSTVSLLNGDFDLSRLPVRCIVSAGTLEVLRKQGRSDLFDRTHGYILFDEGRDRVVLHELDLEAERRQADQARKFADKVEATCEIVSGRPLARISPETRKMLLRIFGSETAESIAVAKERNCLFWTDDFVTSVVVEKELSLQRTWTQSTCLWLRAVRILTDRECDVITSRLCGFGYHFTAISVSTIIVACELCEWDPNKQPLLGVLSRVKDFGRGQDLLFAAANLLPTVWREAPLDDFAARVTIRVLEILSHSSRGISVIIKVLRRIDTIFGVNVIGATKAREVIEAWLNTTEGRSQVIGP